MKSTFLLLRKYRKQMDRQILSKINTYIKQERLVLNEETVCTYYYENNYLEISFENGQCSYDKVGACTMCDYGIASSKKDVSIFIEEMLRIYNLFSKVDSLMLCTNGSFLDDNQLSLDFQKSIMETASKLSCKKIYIETHYSTITYSKLELIKILFKNKIVKIELGLETINFFYQEYILNKKISVTHLKEAIVMIRSFGYIPIVNLLLGLPFLDERQQVNDILASIDWCIHNRVEIVLFPINIKRYTLIYYLYKNGLYSPISHWEMIYVLSIIDETYLSKIDIAYWGNRDDSNNNEITIFPSTCPKCRNLIHNFYIKYLATGNSGERKKLINDLLESHQCDCMKTFQNKLVKSRSNDFDIKNRIEKAYAQLLHEFNERI